MKAIMYHYVQSFDKDFKKFSYLDFRNFKKQIKFFKQKYKFFDCNELFEKNFQIKNRIFLTFDDGLSCHYKYVFDILKKEKINAIFYIPTLPFQKKKILSVHKIHLILGKIGEVKSSKILNTILKKNQNFIDNNLIEKFKNKIYKDHGRNYNSQIFKSYLNYFIKPKFRRVVINKIFVDTFGNNEEKICKKFYLTEKNLKKMAANNMIIGSHSQNHNLMSELKFTEFKNEIDTSFKYVNLFFKRKTFSYPYGGFHSFNKKIENYLDLKSVSFSVNVESKDINYNHISKRRQALPRFDCNEFKYGKISR